MLNYNHLYYFHVVATEGSFANAAQRLGVTQPTISEQVKALERVLGVALFERQPAGLRLTEEGRVTFEHTTVMFRAGDNLRQALGHDPTAVPRTLRVGLSGAVGRTSTTTLLLPLLALPGCIPSIRSADGTELVRDIRAAELDLALLESEPTAAAIRGLEVARLDTITLLAVTAPNVTPAADWGDLGIVHYRASSAFRWDVDAYLEDHGLRPRLVGEADDAQFLVEAAARGGYVAFIPRSVARDAIRAGRLKVLATTEAVHAGLYAVLQDGSTADLARDAVKRLIEHLASP